MLGHGTEQSSLMWKHPKMIYIQPPVTTLSALQLGRLLLGNNKEILAFFNFSKYVFVYLSAFLPLN